MRTTEQIKQYLDEHFFETRRHAHGIRAILVDLFPEEKEFNYQWVSSKNEATCKRTTFDKAHDFIFYSDNLNNGEQGQNR